MNRRLRPIVTVALVANDHHHPHPKVMRLLEKSRNQITLYRTDIEGTITAVCDGANIEINTDKQIARERLYLTGDEVAGTVASDGRGEGSQHSRRNGRRSR